MSSFVNDKSSNIKSTKSEVKTLQELAASTLASTAANQLKESSSEAEDKETREAVNSIEQTFTKTKNTLALVFVLDNTASQGPSWELIKNTLYGLIPFLESRHGEEHTFKIIYEIRIIYANDYTKNHTNDAATAKRTNQKYIADPRASVEGEKPVVGELCRITSNEDKNTKDNFIDVISKMTCYGGGDRAEAYSPALELALEHVNELRIKYGDNAVVATIFCGDDIPHGCSTQLGSFCDNWDEGDPSGIDWFEVISRFPCPIHCLSPPHADEDSRCTLGYAAKKTGGFHLMVNQDSSRVLLRLLMAEMKLSWLVERNLKDMESATPEDISSRIAELVNKESFVKPTNTVPVDPRIEKIDEEINKSGFKPSLMRSVTESVPCKRYRRDIKTMSSLEKGVSSDGVMRALRTATGGLMKPELIRMVSDNVAKSTIDENHSTMSTLPILSSSN